MFKIFSRLTVCVALAVCLFLTSVVRAQDVTVTIPSLNEVQAKISALAGKINPSFPLLVNMTLGQYVAFGIDPDKPIAIYGDLVNQKTGLAIFLPVKSPKMFEVQFKAMQEKGQFRKAKVEFRDDYAILLFDREWTGEIPIFQTPKVLNAKIDPRVFIPLLEAQLAAVELLKDDEKRIAMQNSLERAIRNLTQMMEFNYALDSNENGDLEAVFTVKPVEGSAIAGNYANTEMLAQSLLCDFFDENAPFAAQFLGAFDANNRRDLVEGIAANARIPEELGKVILAAMEVKKFDLACSFYPDKVGVYGSLAMGISNGDQINAAFEKAIAKIKSGDPIQGKANAAKMGKFTVHTFKFQRDGVTKNFAVAVHPNYLFYVVAPVGKNATNYLVSELKSKKLKPAKVAHKAQIHFNMDLLESSLQTFGVTEKMDLTGAFNYVVDFVDGQLVGTAKMDCALLESAGAIWSAIQYAQEGDDDDDDDDDLFGDDDDDDENAEDVEEDVDAEDGNQEKNVKE